MKNSVHTPTNLFDYTVPKAGESFTPLLENEKVKILRIVSSDTPDDTLYDQEEDEWVALLEGSAVLEMEGRVNRIDQEFGAALGEALTWLKARPHLAGIIITSGHKDFCVGADLDLLSGQDLLPSPLPEDEQRRLEARFPQDLSIGDAVYRIRYDVPNRTATLHQVSGTRKTPPGEMYWPRLPGWKLQWEYKRRVRTLRG